MLQPISVLVIDHQPQVRAAIGRILASEPGFLAGGEASCAQEGLELLKTGRHALVLLGLDGHDGRELETLRSIKAAHPGVRCIILAGADCTGNLLDALKAGADGYLLRNAPPAVLCAKLRKAMSGITVVQEELKQALIDSILQKQATAQEAQLEIALTRRESEILDCLTRQLDTRTIAHTLGISVSTVKTHIKHLLVKLNLSSRPDASTWAHKQNLLSRISLQASAA